MWQIYDKFQQNYLKLSFTIYFYYNLFVFLLFSLHLDMFWLQQIIYITLYGI